MALTIASLKITPMGDRYCATGTIALDSSYATGGESLTAANVGLRVIDFIMLSPRSGLVFDYDYTNSKMLCYVPGAAFAAAGSATLDDYALTGTGSSTAISLGMDNAATSPVRFGLMKEVANTENLATITGIRFIAFGA